MCLGEVFKDMFLLYHFLLTQVLTIHDARLRCYPRLQLCPNVPIILFKFPLTLCNTYTIVIGKGWGVGWSIFVKMMKACMYNNLVVHVSLPQNHSKSKLHHLKWKKELRVGVLFICLVYIISTIYYQCPFNIILLVISLHTNPQCLNLSQVMAIDKHTLWYFNWSKVGRRWLKTSMLIACSYSQGCLQQDIASDYLNRMKLIS